MKKLISILPFLFAFACVYSQAAQYSYSYPKQFYSFPKASADRADVFSDKGSWFGFSLPLKENTEQYGKFGGPYCLFSNRWISESMLKFSHSIPGLGKIDLKTAKEISFKIENKVLTQRFDFENYFIELRLVIVSSRASLYSAQLVNTSDKKMSVSMELEGELFPESGFGEKLDNGWIVSYQGKNEIMWILQVGIDRDIALSYSKTNYSLGFEKAQELASGDTLRLLTTLSQIFSGDPASEVELSEDVLKNSEKYYENGIRVEKNIKKKANLSDSLRQELVMNCFNTISLNFREHLPWLEDSRYLRGTDSVSQVVAVDESWVLASSILAFDLHRAKAQLFYLLKNLNDNNSLNKFLNKDGNNTQSDILNEKPMAAWTAWNLYSINSNKLFLYLVFNDLEKYHSYWYSERDKNNNMWCENADGIETVSLNAMLFIEKKCLRDIAIVLEDEDKVRKYNDDMFDIMLDFNKHFFDMETTSYVDVLMKSNTRIPAELGFEYALWAGLTTQEIAEYFVSLIESNIKNQNVKDWVKGNKIDLESFYLMRLGLINFDRADLAEIIKEEIVNEYIERLKNSYILYYDFEEGRTLENSSYLSAILLMFLVS